ncbi:unnamed protein product [Soboliphyme baturini]|uniref:Transthyretin-like family protein n=1 Tax=Soboliphyme baturini TaxID=241478 RepID=A0A183J001_9BILA|nr:unnamed protein product [Soboliphyme baturini]
MCSSHKNRILLLLLSSLAMFHGVCGTRECVTITGVLKCHDRPSAVSGVDIKMYDKDYDDEEELSDPDDKMGETQTDENGKFSIYGCAYDSDGSKGPNYPEPYIEIFHFCRNRQGRKTMIKRIFQFHPAVNDLGNIYLDAD